MRFTTSFAVFLFACSGHASIGTTTPSPAPAPAAPAEPAAAPAEPEEPPPAVKEEPKTIDIQSDVIRLKPGMTIRFAKDSDQILAESNQILDEVAAVMSQNEKIHVRVEGHTDNTGDKDHNQDLSTRRAAAVKTYLSGKGLAADRLDSLGCGQGTPMADNGTEDGRTQNRRVEFVIVRANAKHPRGNCELYKPREHHHKKDKDAAKTPAGA